MGKLKDKILEVAEHLDKGTSEVTDEDIRAYDLEKSKHFDSSEIASWLFEESEKLHTAPPGSGPDVTGKYPDDQEFIGILSDTNLSAVLTLGDILNADDPLKVINKIKKSVKGK